MVALVLGSSLKSVKDSKQIFRKLCEQGFKKRALADFPLVRGQHQRRHKSSKFEDELRTELWEEPIFGGTQKPGGSNRLRVGVVSTSSNGDPCLHANYNRAQSQEGKLLHGLYL